MCFIGMTVYKYFDIEYIGYKNKKLALYLVFVQTQFQTQTQKQAKVSLTMHGLRMICFLSLFATQMSNICPFPCGMNCL